MNEMKDYVQFMAVSMKAKSSNMITTFNTVFQQGVSEKWPEADRMLCYAWYAEAWGGKSGEQ